MVHTVTYGTRRTFAVNTYQSIPIVIPSIPGKDYYEIPEPKRVCPMCRKNTVSVPDMSYDFGYCDKCQKLSYKDSKLFGGYFLSQNPSKVRCPEDKKLIECYLCSRCPKFYLCWKPLLTIKMPMYLDDQTELKRIVKELSERFYVTFEKKGLE